MPVHNPPVPVDLVPDAGAPEAIFAVFAVLALLLVVEAFRYWRRTGRALLLVVIVGALCTNPIEGIADELGYVWYADPEQATWYRSFVPMPTWMIPAYIVFFAGLTMLVMRYISSERPRRAFIRTTLVCWAINVVIEVPILHTDAYTYYSDNQPLSVGGFPLYWLVLNSAGPTITAVVLYRLRDVLTGARVLLVLPIMPMAYGAAMTSAGFPVFNLLHSNAPQWAVEVAALLTVAIGLGIYWVVMELTAADGRWRALYRGESRSEEPRPQPVSVGAGTR